MPSLRKRKEVTIIGTDMVIMIEVSHGDHDPWHPLRDSPMAYEVPRNNVLFSMLADVGNRSGRWEPRWQEPRTITADDGSEVNVPGWWYDPDDGGHAPLIPIDGPRGIPDNASMEWRANVAIWESQREMVLTSYLTPEDILAGQWDQRVLHQAIVTEEAYLAYRDEGTLPQMWVGAVGGEGARTVTVAEYEAGERGENSTAVQMEWEAGTAMEACALFLDMVADMATLNAMRSTSSIRFMVLFEC